MTASGKDLSKPKPKCELAAPETEPDPWRLLEVLEEASSPPPKPSVGAVPSSTVSFPDIASASAFTPSVSPNLQNDAALQVLVPTQGNVHGAETGSDKKNLSVANSLEPDDRVLDENSQPGIEDSDIDNLLKKADDQVSECGSSSSFLSVGSDLSRQMRAADHAMPLNNQNNLIAAAHLSLRSPLPKLLWEEGFWGSFFNSAKKLDDVLPHP